MPGLLDQVCECGHPLNMHYRTHKANVGQDTNPSHKCHVEGCQCMKFTPPGTSRIIPNNIPFGPGCVDKHEHASEILSLIANRTDERIVSVQFFSREIGVVTLERNGINRTYRMLWEGEKLVPDRSNLLALTIHTKDLP